jgi:hypothetical protein
MYFLKTGRYHHKKTVYMISHIMYVGLIMTVGRCVRYHSDTITVENATDLVVCIEERCEKNTTGTV